MRGIAANPAREGGGEFQGAKPRGPVRSWDYIVEKPNVDLMAELLQFFGMMKDVTGGDLPYWPARPKNLSTQSGDRERLRT